MNTGYNETLTHSLTQSSRLCRCSRCSPAGR